MCGCSVPRVIARSPSAYKRNLGRVANPRPVAKIKKSSTGRVVQRQVLVRTVGHGDTGFLGRSLADPVGQNITVFVFTAVTVI